LFDHIDATQLGFWFPLAFIVVVCGFIVCSLWLAPKVLNFFFSRLGIRGDGHLTYLFAGILFIAVVGELLGISVIVSSFVAGMALVRTPAFREDSQKLHRDIEGIGFGFVIPFLFLTIGMQTDIRVLFQARENLALVVLVVAGLVTSKVFSGWLAMRLAGFDNLKSLCVGLMTTPQLDATLAAAAVALHLKMIPSVFFNAVVILSIVTSIFGPIFTKLVILKGGITFDQPEDVLTEEIIDVDNIHL
jgi:Kef-type K+ transport system membrane component KefB